MESLYSVYTVYTGIRWSQRPSGATSHAGTSISFCPPRTVASSGASRCWRRLATFDHQSCAGLSEKCDLTTGFTERRGNRGSADMDVWGSFCATVNFLITNDLIKMHLRGFMSLHLIPAQQSVKRVTIKQDVTLPPCAI